MNWDRNPILNLPSTMNPSPHRMASAAECAAKSFASPAMTSGATMDAESAAVAEVGLTIN